MANVYIRSAAGGSANGTSWANAYLTVAAAYAGTGGNNAYWISEDHAETQGSAMTLTGPGSGGGTCTAICVSHTGTVPPVSADLATTATITTTGNFGMTINGIVDYQGITFSAGSGAVAASLTVGGAGTRLSFKNCLLKKAGTSGSFGTMVFTTAIIKLFNTSVQFGSTGDSLLFDNRLRLTWESTATPIAGTVPTQPFLAYGGSVNFSGLDFSGAGYNSKTLFSNYNITASDITFDNCALNATSFVLVGAQSGVNDNIFYNIRSDSGATNYMHQKYSYLGAQVTETTIVRTGGATDGTTPISWKITSNPEASWPSPFGTMPIAIWNDTTASNVTVTLYGVWGGGAVPTNRDIWPVISYMGSSGTPIATIVSGGAADYLAAATNWSADGSTWGGSTTAFKMAVTLSSPQPAMKGPIYVKIMSSGNGNVFYIDPKIVLT